MCTGAWAARCGHLTRGERDGLHGPAVHGGDEVAAALLRRGKSAARKASVTMAIDAYGISASRAAASPAAVLQQPRGRGGGGGEDHRVGVQVLGVGGRADGEPPARRRALELADHRVRADVGARGLGHRLRQRADPGRQRDEDRRRLRGGTAGRGGACRRLLLLSAAAAGRRWREQRGGRLGQGGVPARRRGERGERGLEGQVLGPARVHAAEQRVDEPVNDLDAEPRADVLGDRRVAALGRPAATRPWPARHPPARRPRSRRARPGRRARP